MNFFKDIESPTSWICSCIQPPDLRVGFFINKSVIRLHRRSRPSHRHPRRPASSRLQCAVASTTSVLDSLAIFLSFEEAQRSPLLSLHICHVWSRGCWCGAGRSSASGLFARELWQRGVDLQAHAQDWWPSSDGCYDSSGLRKPFFKTPPSFS